MFGRGVQVTGTIDELSVSRTFQFQNMDAAGLITAIREASSKGKMFQVTDSNGVSLILNFALIRVANLNITDVNV